jgi:hypothetical protein
MSSLSVAVEVTSEIFKAGKSEQQQCYIDLGGKYPEAIGRFIGEEGPLPPGMYVATKGRIENYRPVIDLRQLQKAKA